MNLGQAVAVCLYEIVRSPAAAKAEPEAKRPAAPETSSESRHAGRRSWSNPATCTSASKDRRGMKLRRLIRRMKLNAHDAEVWLGMLRQIRWKLSKGSV